MTKKLSAVAGGRQAARRLIEDHPDEAARICVAVESLVARLRDGREPKLGYERVHSDPFYEQTVGR